MPRSERQHEVFKGGVSVTTPGGAGLGQINSGDTSTTVSHRIVTSGQPILLTLRAINTASPSFVGSGQGLTLGISSIVENVSMMVVTGGGVATTAPIGFGYWILR